MKNALILHGAGNNSSGNWFPWLKVSLENKGWKVWCPNLPNSEHPIEKEWINTIFSNKDWLFNEESLIIGHSAGATLALRILENLPENLTIDKTILAACYVNLGNKPQFIKYKEGMLKKPFNWRRIRQSSKEFYFICSDNDPYDCGDTQNKILEKNLGGKLIIKKGQGHFNLEKSPKYKEFPAILKYIN